MKHINSTSPASNATVFADCTTFYFIAWGLIGGGLCIFGFVGNSLSLLAFQKDKRVPATTLLQALAISDFVLLLSVFITDPVPYVCDYIEGCVNPWVSWPFIRYIWILTPIAHMCSIWFVVLIALNRYYAVCQALDMGHVWNNQRTYIYIFVVLFVVVAFNMPRFMEYTMVQVPCDLSDVNMTSHFRTNVTDLSNNVIYGEVATNISSSFQPAGEPCHYWKEYRTEFGSHHTYKVVYKVLLVNILLVLVPIILLIALTMKILVTLKETRRRIRTAKQTNRNGVTAATRKCSVKKQRNKNSYEITVILTLVVVVAIICQAPLCVFHFVRYTAKYNCGHIVFYLDNISKLLVNVNSSSNFIIYCLFSPKFRKLLLSFWVCSFCGLQPPERVKEYTSVSRKEYSVKDYRTEPTARPSPPMELLKTNDNHETFANSREKLNKTVSFNISNENCNNKDCNGEIAMELMYSGEPYYGEIRSTTL